MHIDQPSFDLPEGFYKVIYKPNPFRSDGAVFATFHQSANLADVVKKLQIPYLDQSEIYIEGTHVPREHWDKVRPNAGVEVQVRVVPAITGAIGIIAAIAGSYTTSAIAGIIGTSAWATLISTAAGAVVSGLVTIGLNKALGIGKTAADDPINADIRGARNVANWYGAVPVVLGTHRMAPLYAGMPYTETTLGARYLRMLMVWGYGPVRVQQIKMGEQLLSEFEDVEQEDDLDGTSGGLDLYPNDADQQAFMLELELDDGYWTRTTAIETTTIEIAFSWPNGLFETKSSKRYPRQTPVQAQYRLQGSGVWIDWFDDGLPASPISTSSAVYYSKRLTGLASGIYEVQVKRTNESGKAADNSKRNDAVFWTDLNSFGSARPVNLSGVALSAFRIKASGQLSGAVDQINAVVSLKVKTWNGSVWSGENVTSNPAAIYRWVLTGSANGAPLVGARVNDQALGDWYDYCDTNGLEYNRVITGRTSIKDVLNEVAAAGYATPTITDNQWSVIIDDLRSVVVQQFTPRNSWGFSSTIVFPEIPHALRGRFLNEQAGYIEDERLIYDVGFDQSNAENFQVVSFPGHTKPGQVWKAGRRLIKSMRLRPEVFTFSTDIEGLIATRGDLVRLNHDVAMLGTHFGRLTSVAGSTVTTDEVITTVAGVVYSIRVRKSNGTSELFGFTASVTEATQTLVVPGISGVATGDHFTFGLSGADSAPLIVQSIEPGDDMSMKLVCIPYQEALYDPQAAPTYVTTITTPTVLSLMGPPKPRIYAVISDERAMTRTARGAIIPGIKVFIKDRGDIKGAARTIPTASFRVRFRESVTGGDPNAWVYVAETNVDTPVVLIGGVEVRVGYDIEVQSIGVAGEPGGWARVSNHVVIGAATTPPPVRKLSLNTRNGISYVAWRYPDEPVDLKGFVLKYHFNTGVTAWKKMKTLAKDIPRDARSFAVPTRAGSYAIRAVDVTGKRSTSVFINNSEADADAWHDGETLTIYTVTED